MMLKEAAFYFFSFCLIFAAFRAVTLSNPLYALFALIIAIVNAAVLFAFLNTEFLAFALIVISVGGVSILILFAIMLTKAEDYRRKVPFFKDLGAAFLPAFFCLACVLFLTYFFRDLQSASDFKDPPLSALAEKLYGPYSLIFILTGAVILCAMVSSAALLVDIFVKKRRIRIDSNAQKSVDPKEVVTLHSVPLGEGSEQ